MKDEMKLWKEKMSIPQIPKPIIEYMCLHAKEAKNVITPPRKELLELYEAKELYRVFCYNNSFPCGFNYIITIGKKRNNELFMEILGEKLSTKKIDDFEDGKEIADTICTEDEVSLNIDWELRKKFDIEKTKICEFASLSFLQFFSIKCTLFFIRIWSLKSAPPNSIGYPNLCVYEFITVSKYNVVATIQYEPKWRLAKLIKLYLKYLEFVIQKTTDLKKIESLQEIFRDIEKGKI